MTAIVRQRQQMRLIGRSYMAFVLAPEEPISGWLTELDAWLARSRGFFVGRPVVIDLSSVQQPNSQTIAQFVANLKERGIRILAFEGVDASQLGPELPPLLREGRPVNTTDSALSADKRPAAAAAKASPSLLLEQPVRSGQSVVFTEGDITVLGSVGSGAEIVAGGSIHVYGTLRGRAMAGAAGNPRARIFCQRIEAELLAIDGYYRTAEEIDDKLRSRPTQAWLEGGTMMITALN